MGGASLLSLAVLSITAFAGREITPEYAGWVYVLTTAIFCVLGFIYLCWTWHCDKQLPAKCNLEQSVEAELISHSITSNQASYEQFSARNYFSASLHFVVIAGTLMLGNWSGVFFLQYFQGDAATAVFAAARRTSLFPVMLMSIVVTTFSPRLAGLYQSGDRKRLKMMVHRSSLIVFLANAPVLVLMTLGAPWWMALFGSEFQSQWGVLAIMSGGQLVSALTGIATGVMGMTGNQRQLSSISIYCALAAILMSAILSATLGVRGAAIAAAAYAALQSVLVALAVRQQLGYFPFPRLGPGVA
jgi:O-antigen/teichoic acid export membrane protein